MLPFFRSGRRHGRQRGQSLVEFTMIIPILMTMSMSIAEFGVAFGTNMSMIEATREGARVGAVLVDGSKGLGLPTCPTGAAGAATVDPQIILAVQRAIESPGSGIALANVDWIHIYKADANGNPFPNTTNEWLVGPSTACSLNLDFKQVGTVQWPASSRSNALPVASIGVSIEYRYQLFTPLSALTGLFGLHQITMVDSTVMDLEP
jgi:hypothetical protein